jgi:hypothetical protein
MKSIVNKILQEELEATINVESKTVTVYFQ